MSKSNDFIMKDSLSNDNHTMFDLDQGNPGAYKVISKLFAIMKSDQTKYNIIIKLINNLIIKNIVGARLWYIYKNEAKLNINNLLDINLDNFTDEYFYNKFEKYF